MSAYSRSRRPDSSGSSLVRNSSEGRPPNSRCHMALWPAAQRERRMVSGSVWPVSTAEIQSQCSTQEKAFSRMDSSARKVRKILAQYHSEE